MARTSATKRTVASSATSAKGGTTTSDTTLPQEVTSGTGRVRKIKYPRLEILEYSSTSENGPLGPQDWKDMLGWETESQYKTRMILKYPDSKPTDHQFYDDYHCIDRFGEKVRCNNNGNNRPFDMDWCEEQIRMVLQGEWAGPLTYPGETVNGETVRISRYEEVLSGQHQGSACILADQDLQISRNKDGEGNVVPIEQRQRPFYDPNDPSTEKYPFWAGHKNCVIETIVVLGVSDDERVLRTIDYVKERTLSDVLFTMDIYRKNSPIERKEMTRMLAIAIDLLWDRTHYEGYKTHPELVAFLKRHMTLLDCVQHLFIENTPKIFTKKRNEGESDQAYNERLSIQSAQGGRRISKLHLSAGQASALCYLMGTMDEKEPDDNYHSMVPPDEKNIDFSMLPKAKEFWTRLAGDRAFMPVRKALDSLFPIEGQDKDDLEGLGGRFEEKLAVIARAWDIFHDHPEEEDNPAFPYEVDSSTNEIVCSDLEPGGLLKPEYSNKDSEGKDLPKGKSRLVDVPDFHGIDCPGEKPGKSKKKKPKSEPPEKKTNGDPTPEQIYGDGGLGEQARKETAKKDEEKKSKRKIRRK